MNTAQRDAVNYAMKQIGKEYQWAGVGPASFDCSGLTLKAAAAGGVVLPHQSGEQARLLNAVPYTKGTKALLEPGDLVFYYGSTADPASISHVAMYTDAIFGLKHVVAAVDEQYGVKHHGMFWALAPSGFGYVPYPGRILPTSADIRLARLHR